MELREHLQLHLERVRWMVQRAMRRHPDRFLQADGSYSDLCVGPQELKRLLGLLADPSGDLWLDRLGVAPLEVIEESLLDLEEAIDDFSAGAEGSLPLDRLKEGFGLSNTEIDLLVAAAAPRLSVDLSRLFVVAWADFSARQPTAGFLAELVATRHQAIEDVLELLSDRGRLSRYRLLDFAAHDLWKPATPRLHALVVVPERVLSFMRGRPPHDAELFGGTMAPGLGALSDLVMDDEQRRTLESVTARQGLRLCLQGPPGSGRRTLARAMACQTGRSVLEVDLSRLLDAAQEDALAPMIELLREARMGGALTLLRFDGVEDRLPERHRPRLKALRAALVDHDGPLIACDAPGGQRARLLLGDMIEVVVKPPDRAGQRLLWTRALSPLLSDDEVESLVEPLSRVHQLTPGAIHAAVRSALDHHPAPSPESPILTLDRLLKTIRRQFNHNLGWLADVVNAPMGFDEIVLDHEVRERLLEVLRFARHADQVFRRWGFSGKSQAGAGLSVLFSGPPGTGKTLTAGILARELDKVLYRVDLSRIVDKYIGETEKNLARVFDEAERAQAVLLFDEADSLFAKRTQVKSSNDRYANLEVNFLLQRLESYEGVSILTTNFATSIDEAFQRRIRFKITFPMPDAGQRALLWQTLLPPSAPVAQGVEWNNLGERFEFSGGHIRNAVLRAAVHAAEARSPIDEELLYRAALAESREMGLLTVAEE